MVSDLLLTIFKWLIQVVVFILPSWQVWPQDFVNGLQYFFSSLAKLNFIVPIDTLFTALLFLINFEVLLFGARLILKIINFFRGSGELKI